MRRLSALPSRFAAPLALALVAGLALGAAGCDDKKKTEATPTPSATMTTSTTADAATAMAGDAMAATDETSSRWVVSPISTRL